jgi:hypothetical protein
MKIVPKLVLLAIVLCLASSAALAQNHDAAVIEKFIASQAAQIGGEEYPDARKVIAGDLNHDGTPDMVVLYTIEGMGGGNNYVQYLAVFVRLKGRLDHLAHTEVGGKLNRSVELKSIKNNVVFCTTLGYGPKDPSCCPTRKGTARFVLAGKKIKQA